MWPEHRVAEGLALASGAKAALLEYRSTTGNWDLPSHATTNAHVGLPPYNEITGQYVRDVGVRFYSDRSGVFGDGDPGVRICVRFNAGIHPKVEGGAVALVPIDEGGSVSFICHNSLNHGDVNDLPRYRPSSCRP